MNFDDEEEEVVLSSGVGVRKDPATTSSTTLKSIADAPFQSVDQHRSNGSAWDSPRARRVRSRELISVFASDESNMAFQLNQALGVGVDNRNGGGNLAPSSATLNSTATSSSRASNATAK